MTSEVSSGPAVAAGLWRPNRREALLLAMLPFVAVALLNHHYKDSLLAWGLAWYWAADAVHFVVVPVASWVFLSRTTGLQFADMGLSRLWRQDRYRPRLTWGFAVFVALFMLAAYWPICEIVLRLFRSLGNPVGLNTLMPTGYGAWLVVSFYMAASAALAEELIWRGMAWTYFCAALPARYRRLTYVLATSAVFAVAHSEQGPGGVLAALWFGVLAAGLYTKVRSLWPIVLCHFMVDWIIFGPWSRPG
ncbi:MAG: CPBP family intramembrane metalloprotease [Ramlibacter sp.]|nr:CPBP family intramembrane metalloprotease [Ramlibacter sp.]